MKTQQKKVSIIVSIYNIASYLERSIASICSQSYENIEILLVDDGSTDESGKICDTWAKKDSRIRVIHKKNGGLSSARNAGIEAAKGEYLTFVDGDDWIDSTMYEDMIRALEEEEADLCICNYREIREEEVTDSGEEKSTVLEGREILEAFLTEEESYRIQNAAWNKLYKRELLGELRFPEGKLFEDIVFTTKLMERSRKMVYLHQTYYNYVMSRSDSIMNSVKADRILKDQVEAYREKGEFLKTLEKKEYYLTHQYFFYKRMLLHYLQFEKDRPENYQSSLKRLREILKKDLVWEAYEGRGKGDYYRMKLFCFSPRLFTKVMKGYEKYVLPYKELKASKEEELVVIQLSGGLGNQMFQYALYLKLKHLGRNVKIDDKTEYESDKARPIRLDIFGITYPRPVNAEMIPLTDSYLDLVSRIRRKLTGRQSMEYREKSADFDPKVLELKRAYLTGCWQSEKYFSEIREEVREAFRFQKICLSKEMRAYEEQMKEKESVCVHIRRGDYLQVNEVYGGICTEEYYEKAMQQMIDWLPNCHFFFFTNDVSWVKEHYPGENITVVEGNDEDRGYLDLYLMTKCKHYILANSSFSWWGCYLNPSKEKRVIAPSRWTNKSDSRDIYTEEMKLL